ncbi:poly [ADP-ribose] polymerase 14-like, partial [Clarias magur]
MSDYEYAVLFEAKNLSHGDVKKIRNYFQIRRHSGGGECGEVEKVADNTYKISFLDKAEKKELLPHSTPDPQVGAISRNMHMLNKASGNTPMQKVFKLDSYLLNYLKDNSKARSYLEKQLSSLLSNFKLDLVTETVVVMRDAAQTDQNDVVQQKWEAKVDIVVAEIQDRHIIHFEVEPKRLEILQNSSDLFAQNLAFYKEEGLYVIVGECEEVEKFLKVIDTLHLRQQARKECPVSETRYALVKEQFEQVMKSEFPNIQIAQEQHGSLVLKGPEKQIHSAATKLQELLNQIQEEKIPLPRPLKAFISSTGAIQVFQTRFQQNLCSPVLLEATEFSLDLVLLSLSSGALQEAASAIQRDLCMETVLLEQAESKPPVIDTLKNTLTPALQQANNGTSKVEISYESGTGSDPRMKVQLVGYSTEADVLVAPMLNTNLTSTKVGKSFLNKAGQQFKSTFDAAKGRTGNRHSSEQALHCGIGRALALCEQQALSSIAFPVIGPGVALALPVQNAASILTEEIGMFGLAGPTSSLKTIRIVIMPNYPNSEESLSSEIEEITIPLASCKVHLIFGDISNETTDVIVNTTDFTDLKTDVCNDILTVAGPQVMAALTAAQVKKGEIFVTQPGAFPCKAIMHLCGERNTDIIKKLTQDILLQCERSGYQSVAIPAICAGKGGLDARLVAQAILQGVKDATVQAIFNNVKIIHIVLMKIHVFLEFKSMAQQIFGSFTQVKEKEQDDVFSRTSWCILGSRGIWERLPKQAHHQLENKNVSGRIVDAQSQKWTVNIAKMEATAIGDKAVAKIKQLENLSDFSIPLYWDSMTTGEILKVVLLQSSSAEYKKVKCDFKRTVGKAVMKIERIQNVNLRRAYEVRKTELQNKNGPVGAGERSLYHGTTADACASIQHSNFNRRFSGQN